MFATAPKAPPQSRFRRVVKHSLVTLAVVAGSLAVPLAAGPAQAADGFSCTGPGTFFRVSNSRGIGYMSVSRYTTPGRVGGSWTFDTNPLPSPGWDRYGRILGGPNGRAYGINSEGLHRLRWTGSAWATGDQENWRISTSFTSYATAAYRDKITVDELGDFYLIDSNGVLRWYRYAESTKTWTISARAIDTGWNKYNLLVATAPGVLYARAASDGRLYRYRFDPATQRWVDRDRLVSGSFSGYAKGLFSVGGDTLYGVQSNGDLREFRYREDSHNWEVNNNRIATGWDYTAVTASTNACTQSAISSPPRPSTPVQPDAPIAVIQAPAAGTTLGNLEVAYADNIGQLRHGRAHPDFLGTIQWSPVPGVEAYTGKPALAADAQNRVNLFAHETTSNVARLTQKTPNMPDWEPWFGLAGAMKSDPAVVRLSDNNLVVFAYDESGVLWHRQVDSSGTYPLPWRSLGGSALAGTTPVVQAGTDGSATITAVSATGEVVTATWQAGALTSGWTGLGGTGFTGTPTTTVLPGRRTMVLARHNDGSVRAQLQNSDGTWPRSWTPVGDDSITLAGSPSALLSPTTGRMWVFVRGADGIIYRSRQTGPGSATWTSWVPVTSGETYVTDPTALTCQNSGGQQIGFVTRTANSSVRLYAADETMDASAARASRSTADDSFTRHDIPAPPQR